jgi:hypothetical protein
MKYILLIILSLVSFSAFSATRVDCTADNLKFVVVGHSSSDIDVTFNGETVKADGFIDQFEVDLIARFKSIGEMTLFAKRGKKGGESYLFNAGRRISIYCN